MNVLNLVVMGKTGAGKSTLINSVLQEELAPTGTGQAVTKEIKRYSKTLTLPLADGALKGGVYRHVSRKVNLYDTVGLELDSKITQRTLLDIRSVLDKTGVTSDDEAITLVWFCVSNSSSRLEEYEANLIRDLSIEYEIPFIVVITQCLSNEKGDLEKKIEEYYPELPLVRVLAKDYRTRRSAIPAFGVDDLLKCSISDFNTNKISILYAKLDRLLVLGNTQTETLEIEGKRIVDSYVEKAASKGKIPILAIPNMQKLWISMMNDLNDLYDMKVAEKTLATIGSLSTISTSFLAIPLVCGLSSKLFMRAAGNSYLKALSKAKKDNLNENEINRVFEEILKMESRNVKIE